MLLGPKYYGGIQGVNVKQPLVLVVQILQVALSSLDAPSKICKKIGEIHN